MSGHSADPGQQRSVLSGGSQHGPEPIPGQLSGKHGTMSSLTPEPSSCPGKPTPGSKGGNPTYRDQNPPTYNATSASRTNRMEKPHPADQHQCPLSPLTTSIGKPATSEPGNEAPMAETPGATHNTRHEAAIGATQVPHIPEATSARAHGRTRREPPPQHHLDRQQDPPGVLHPNRLDRPPGTPVPLRRLGILHLRLPRRISYGWWQKEWNGLDRTDRPDPNKAILPG